MQIICTQKEFVNSRNMCLKIYGLDYVLFFFHISISMVRSLKNTKLKSYIDLLLMAEKGIRGGICHAIHQYAEANNKYTKDCDKNKQSSFLKYLNVNNLYGWKMSHKFPVSDFKWVENTSEFNKNFLKTQRRF